MKLKTLLIVLLVLGTLAIAATFLNRPKPHAATSSDRIGQPVLSPSLVERAARIDISEGGKTVRLRESAPGSWVVASYHDLPADFAKLSSLVASFTSAKVERLVTQNPERIARLDFSDTRIALADADGKPLLAVTLGKQADSGGRFIRFSDRESAAYLARVNAWLDATDRNWADTTLLKFASDNIARVTVTFPSADPLTVTRADRTAPFTADITPEGQQLKTSAITALLGSLNHLRFTDTTAPDAPEAVGARQHARTITLTTFDGKTHTVAIGRQPERTVVKPDAITPAPSALVTHILNPAPTAAPADLVGPLTETLPAGPVFAFIRHSDAPAPINALMNQRGFHVGEHILNALPATADALFEPAPVATSSSAASSSPSDASEKTRDVE